MVQSTLNLHKKQQRRNNTAKKRQATFIAEYVFNKYFDIYQEAAAVFNQINAIHPKKPDLRTSIEFKNWKRELRGLPKIRPSQKRDPTDHVIYPSISVHETHDVQPVLEGDNIAQIIETVSKKTMQLKIPLLSPQTLKTSPQEETTTDNDEVLDQVLDEGDTGCLMSEQETTTDNDEVLDQVLDEGDTGCLMSEQETTMNKDQVINQVPEEGNNDEVLSVEPSLFEDISPSIMGELLTELRADPNLAGIMNDFETSFSDIDYELDIGMNMEIDDRLERELEVLL